MSCLRTQFQPPSTSSSSRPSTKPYQPPPAVREDDFSAPTPGTRGFHEPQPSQASARQTHPTPPPPMSPGCPRAARFLRALDAHSPTRLLLCSTSHPLGLHHERQPRGAASIGAATLRSTNDAQSRFSVLSFLLEPRTPWKPPCSARSAHGGSSRPFWEGSAQPWLGPKAHTGPAEHFGTEPFPSPPCFLSSNPNPAGFFPPSVLL